MAGNDQYSYSYRSIDSLDEEDDPNQQNYELFENFFVSDEWLNEDQTSVVSGYEPHDPFYVSAAMEVGNGSSSHLQDNRIAPNEIRKTHKGKKEKVAFKTKSEVEILDDGFKWRKYGKKMVKNSPNPRNYYRCSVEGCSVKKRVERDVEDPRYVITTYEGVHNHKGPYKF